MLFYSNSLMISLCKSMHFLSFFHSVVMLPFCFLHRPIIDFTRKTDPSKRPITFTNDHPFEKEKVVCTTSTFKWVLFLCWLCIVHDHEWQFIFDDLFNVFFEIDVYLIEMRNTLMDILLMKCCTPWETSHHILITF